MPRNCGQCQAELPRGARFCVQCGSPVTGVGAGAEAGAKAGGSAPGPAGVGAERERPLTSDRASRLVECDECGAGNAASRAICARCASPMREEIPGGDALPDAIAQPADVGGETGVRRDMPPVLLGLVILAGLVTAGVLLALVSSRMTAQDVSAIPTGVALQAASASTALDGHPASLAIDGNPATAWNEAAEGPGVGEWLEVTMAADVEVRRVLIWNGDQRDDVRFAENGYPTEIRIEIADRMFRVSLQDVQGPQAIDLPEPVTADRLRIVAEEAVSGARYNDMAISEIVVETEE